MPTTSNSPTVPQHGPLSPEQEQRASELWDRIGSRARPNISKAKWIEEFRMDRHPDREMEVWDRIATADAELWDDPLSKNLERRNLLRAIIMVSMGGVDVSSQCDGITDAIVAKIREKLSR